MMGKGLVGRVVSAAVVLLAVTSVYANDVTLNTVLYPDNEKTAVKFATTERAPKAEISGTVRPEAGQS